MTSHKIEQWSRLIRASRDQELLELQEQRKQVVSTGGSCGNCSQVSTRKLSLYCTRKHKTVQRYNFCEKHSLKGI